MSDVADARIATRIADRFLVEERIGAGATGVVYRAVQQPLGRRVALKMLISRDAPAARRFAREARALAKLRHENVVVVHDVGEHEGTAFIAMEYIEGAVLRALLDEGALAVAVVVQVGMGIARALAHAHASLVVHRDLKPQNVMLAGGRTDAASVRVVDFGLARVVEIEGETGDSVSVAIEGTPAYMAPEQIDVSKTGVSIGPACDVYALGVVLYEALTGVNPFRAETAFKTLLRHVEGRAAPPSVHRPEVPAWLDVLVGQMLAKQPSARPSAAGVAARLSCAPQAPAATAPQEVTVPMHPSGEAPPMRRSHEASPMRRAALGVVAMAAIVLAAIAGRTLLSNDGAVHDAGTPPTRDGADAPLVAGRVDARAGIDAGAAAAAGVDGGTLAPAGVNAGAISRRSRVHELGAAAFPAPTIAHPSAVVSSDAGALVAADASPLAPPLQAKGGAPAALVKRVRALESCADPCAVDVATRFEAALVGDLEHLKTWRAELEACRARCP